MGQFNLLSRSNFLQNILAAVLIVSLVGCETDKETVSDIVNREPICIIPPIVPADDVTAAQNIESVLQVCELNENRLPERVSWRAKVGSKELEREIFHIKYVKNNQGHLVAHLYETAVLRDNEVPTEIVVKTAIWDPVSNLPDFSQAHEIVFGDLVFERVVTELNYSGGHSAFDPNDIYTNLFIQQDGQRYFIMRHSEVFRGASTRNQVLPTTIEFSGRVPDKARRANAAWFGYKRLEIIEEGKWIKQSEKRLLLHPLWTVKRLDQSKRNRAASLSAESCIGACIYLWKIDIPITKVGRLCASCAKQRRSMAAIQGLLYSPRNMNRGEC